MEENKKHECECGNNCEQCSCKENKPLAEGDPTAITYSNETMKEQIKMEQEKIISTLEEKIHPQLISKGVSEERFKIFDTMIRIFVEEDFTGAVGTYVHNILCAGFNDSWEDLQKRLKELSESDDTDSNFKNAYNKISELAYYLENAKLTKEEFSYLSRILSHKPIVPVTGNDDEWVDIPEGDNDLQQNKLYGSIFRNNHDNSTAHCFEGKVFSSDGGLTWFTGHTKNLNSSIPVTFPYEVPDKPQYIYVEEVAEDQYVDITGNEERIKFLKEDAELRKASNIYTISEAFSNLYDGQAYKSTNGNLLIYQEEGEIIIRLTDSAVMTISKDIRFVKDNEREKGMSDHDRS